MLDGTWFAEFAPIYEAFAAVGITSREADQYELWEVAAAFGGHRPPEPEAAPVEMADDPYEGFDFVTENERARAEGRPPRLPPPKTAARRR